tara:strand:+ start:13 stop:558 length:546 start_codon:yes stop_codon:yes gene_type:complete
MKMGIGPTRAHTDFQRNCAVCDYTSDFSSGVDNFADGTGANVTLSLSGNADGVGGLDDLLRIRVNIADESAIFVSHNALRGTNSDIQNATVGCRYSVSFKVFFPTGNTLNLLGSCRINGGDLFDMNVGAKALNTWHTITAFDVVAGNVSADGLEIGFAAAQADNADEMYFRDIEINTPAGY